MKPAADTPLSAHGPPASASNVSRSSTFPHRVQKGLLGEGRWGKGSQVGGLGEEASGADHPKVSDRRRTGQVPWGESLGIPLKSVREWRSPASTPRSKPCAREGMRWTKQWV